MTTINAGWPALKSALLISLSDELRPRHYSERTTRQVYIRWVLRYIRFHCKRHPAHLAAAEVTEFLSALAVRSGVSSTQNQGNRRVEIAILVTPDGHSRLERSRFLSPPIVADHRNARGTRSAIGASCSPWTTSMRRW